MGIRLHGCDNDGGDYWGGLSWRWYEGCGTTYGELRPWGCASRCFLSGISIWSYWNRIMLICSSAIWKRNFKMWDLGFLDIALNWEGDAIWSYLVETSVRALWNFCLTYSTCFLCVTLRAWKEPESPAFASYFINSGNFKSENDK